MDTHTRDYPRASSIVRSWVLVSLLGSFSTGTAAAEVTSVTMYPLDGGNGVAVVDWVSSSRLQNKGWLPDEFLIGQLLLMTAGDYLVEQGYTYAAVQWGKSITEIFGPAPPEDGRPYNHLAYGTIERGMAPG
jgi:hypothetical protein